MFQKDFIWSTASYFTELEIDGVKHTKFVVLCSHSIPLYTYLFYALHSISRIMTEKKPWMAFNRRVQLAMKINETYKNMLNRNNKEL